MDNMIKNNRIDYVKFSKGKQTDFLRKIKSNSPLTWIQLARILCVSRSMIYLYLNESCKLPYASFIKLLKLANLDLRGFEFEIVQLISKGDAKVPETMTPKLAEFIGILLGDGSITASKYQICISMDSVLDKKYINEIVKNHFVDLFGKNPGIYYSRTSRNVKCFIYSKEVLRFLTLGLGLPCGKKKYRINNVIPEIFFKDNLLLRSAIRGLFDTEGGFYQHNKTSPRIYIYNTSHPLLESMYRALKQLDYNVTMKKDAVKICRKAEIVKFFKEIGSNNPQKRLKYLIWLKESKVPDNASVIRELVRL